MMFELLHRRMDGSFVVLRHGRPYHVVPNDPLFAEVAAAAEGVDLPPEVAPQAPVTLADYRRAIAAHVDAVAQTRGYDSGVSCAGYVGSTVGAWAAEAAAFVAWRDQVWLEAFEVLASGTAPSIADVLAGLPVIVWPA